MAEFLATRAFSNQLEAIIKNATEEIYLVTPYLQFSKSIYERLIIAERKGVPITIIYGKSDLNSKEWDLLMNLSCNVYFKKELHAKCYANEDNAIVGSMNLYAFSEANNWEMGVLLHKRKDRQAYRDCIEEVQSLLSISEIKRVIQKPAEQFAQPAQQFRVNGPQTPLTGYCIRTGVPIPFNPFRPLSEDAFRVWNQFGDPFFSEQFCHFTGEPSFGETCYDKPILFKNWREAKQLAWERLGMEI